MMNLRCARVVAVILLLLLSTQTCASPSRSSREFVISLEGQLVFRDLSTTNGGWYRIDFSGVTAEKEQLDIPEPGTFSRDGEWRLLFEKEKDTNKDGVVDWRDLSSLYLARAGSSEKSRVDLPFPVGTCAWGTEYIIVACSFASGDVNLGNDANSGNNGVIYLVDLESCELLRRLSDPARSSWLPVWSPDGSMVAFGTGIETNKGVEPKGIQIVDAQTGELIYEIADPSASEPAWSPDSTRIAFVAWLEPGEYTGATLKGMYDDVFYVNLGDESRTFVNVTRTSRFTQIPSALTEQGGITVWDPVWSPDGKAIASVWHRDNKQEIWVTSVDGDGWAKLAGGVDHRYLLIEWRP